MGQNPMQFKKQSLQLSALLLCGLSCFSIQAKTMYTYTSKNGDIFLTDKKQNSRAYEKVAINTFPDANIHQYRNWGGSINSVAKGFESTKNAFDSIILAAANKFGVDPALIKAVMHTESGFNLNARSPVGAQGLMQLMPSTARRFNVTNAYDPEQNIHAGAQYLSWLLKRFGGNTNLALAGYNAGEGNVDKYGGIPPFRETQDYVKRVNARYTSIYANNSINTSTKMNIPSANEIVQVSGNSFTDRLN